MKTSSSAPLIDEKVRNALKDLENKMPVGRARVGPIVRNSVSHVLGTFGEFMGETKARLPLYEKTLDQMDRDVRSYFQAMSGLAVDPRYYVLVDMGVQKIQETLAFVKEKYELESKLEKRMMVGETSIRKLIERCRLKGLDIDENWVLCVSALNILEASVNKKLEELGESLEGAYTQRLERLISAVRQKENRTIQRMLPEALYKGPRQKLDHAGHKYKPTPKEAENIFRQIMDFLDELFPV